MQSPTDPADRTGTIGVEAFDAAYGAGFQTADDSPHAFEYARHGIDGYCIVSLSPRLPGGGGAVFEPPANQPADAVDPRPDLFEPHQLGRAAE